MGIVSKLNLLLCKVSAQEAIEGYEHPELVETVFRKTAAFRPTESWDELAGARTVLDFGGACGLHYKMAQMPAVRWAVVETPAMVKRASELATDHLHFFTSIKDAACWLGDIDAMHSNGALQYADDPGRILQELCSLGAHRMIWRRMKLGRKASSVMQISRLIDNGHGKIAGVNKKLVRYCEKTIQEDTFLKCHSSYRLVERGEHWFNFLLIS